MRPSVAMSAIAENWMCPSRLMTVRAGEEGIRHPPRRFRPATPGSAGGGRFESWEIARCRGNLDIALISLMRDAMLRVSEAAVLTWRDIENKTDGRGRLLIRPSKTDSEGQGAVAFLSAPTMAALGSICSARSADDSVFGLRPNQISRRIKQAAEAAGLGDGLSGHSPRVGMARDLAACPRNTVVEWSGGIIGVVQ